MLRTTVLVSPSRAMPARPAARRLLAVAALLPVLIVAAGCGIGQGNATQKEHTVVKGARLQTGATYIEDIYITPVGNALKVNPGNSIAASNAVITPNQQVPPSVPASGAIDGYIVATLTNSSDTKADSVSSVTLAAPSSSSAVTPAGGSGGEVSVLPTSAKLTVPPDGQLFFDDPADHAEGNGPYLVITGLTTPLVIGTTIPVTFTMASTGAPVTADVPITTSDFGPPPRTPRGVTFSPTLVTSGSPASAPQPTGNATP